MLKARAGEIAGWKPPDVVSYGGRRGSLDGRPPARQHADSWRAGALTPMVGMTIRPIKCAASMASRKPTTCGI